MSVFFWCLGFASLEAWLRDVAGSAVTELLVLAGGSDPVPPAPDPPAWLELEPSSDQGAQGSGRTVPSASTQPSNSGSSIRS